jgi:hypothetical protein
LLVRHEELQARHTPVSAAELCHDCPELLAALERQIADLACLNALLDPGECARRATSRSDLTRLGWFLSGRRRDPFHA